MREASAYLATNKTKLALKEYEAHGRIHSCRDKDEAIRQLIANWDAASSKGVNSLILAHLRRDVQKLNVLARQKLIDRNVIGREFPFETSNGSKKWGEAIGSFSCEMTICWVLKRNSRAGINCC